MTKVRFSLLVVTALFVPALFSNTHAQSRVFVSSAGNDANPCTRTAPCRNFQRGHDAVAAGGEVVALDAAGYGAVVITKSVTLTGEATYAGITISSGDAITINTASLVVNLRSLQFEGLGTGNRAIFVNTGATGLTLSVENCLINRFSDGLMFNGDGSFFVTDTTLRNNSHAFQVGSTNPVKGFIEHCRMEKQSDTHFINGGQFAKVTIRDSVISVGNTSGIVGSAGETNVEHCSVMGMVGAGIANNGGASATTIVRVGRSFIMNNGTGFLQNNSNSSTFFVRANLLGGNTTDTDNAGGGNFNSIVEF